MEASGGVVTPGTGVREGEKEREEARAIARRGPRRNWVRPLLMWIAVVFICIFCLFPFYWLINVSLKTGSDLSQSDIFPPSPTLDNYSSIFKNDDFTSALKNSVIVTTITTILALIVGSFAAYALARLRFRRITIPLLMPAILVALIFRTLDALRIFDLPYVLTQGANGTTTLSLIAHQELTTNRLIGYGSALSVLTFVIVMAVSFLYIRTVGGNIKSLAEEG